MSMQLCTHCWTAVAHLWARPACSVGSDGGSKPNWSMCWFLLGCMLGWRHNRTLQQPQPSAQPCQPAPSVRSPPFRCLQPHCWASVTAVPAAGPHRCRHQARRQPQAPACHPHPRLVLCVSLPRQMCTAVKLHSSGGGEAHAMTPGCELQESAVQTVPQCITSMPVGGLHGGHTTISGGRGGALTDPHCPCMTVCREWVETGAMSWGEMLGILDAAAAAHPWEERTPSLLFRGAPTGATRPALASDLRCMGCCGVGPQAAADAASTSVATAIDVVIDSHIHGPGMYKSLYQHCAHK